MSGRFFARRAAVEALELALRKMGDGQSKWAMQEQAQVVRAGVGDYDITAYPHLAIYPTTMASRHESNDGTGYRSICDQDVMLRFRDQPADGEFQDAIDRMEHDARLAVDADPTLGCTVLKAEVRSTTPWVDVNDMNECGIDIQVLLRFRYHSSDPTTPV